MDILLKHTRLKTLGERIKKPVTHVLGFVVTIFNTLKDKVTHQLSVNAHYVKLSK